LKNLSVSSQKNEKNTTHKLRHGHQHHNFTDKSIVMINTINAQNRGYAGFNINIFMQRSSVLWD